MRLTRLTGHALRILIDCAQSGGELVKAATIAERLGITLQNTFKIVHVLSHAGFLSPVRGRSGGVRLARSPHEILIGDVVRATEVTSIDIEGEADESAAQGGKERPIRRVLDEALEAFVTVLDQHTLAEMAGLPARDVPLARGGGRKRSGRKAAL